MNRPLLAVAGIVVAASQLAAAGPPVQRQQFLSKVYTIDRKYRSMEGPASMQKISLGDPSRAELLWIVGIRTEMVGEDGTTPQLPELMCHVNVDLDPAVHQALFEFQRITAARLMTLSQGMLEAKLPPGFGFPVASNEPLLLFTQVLNHNIEHPNNLQVRHRVTFEYVRDRDLTEPMKPLFNVGASGMVQLNDNPIALASMMPSAMDGMAGMDHSGANCIVAARAPQAMSGNADYTDPTGRKMTGHWIVPPGRQVNASDITWFMQLPYDARLHYAAVHLHPFAESLSIRDVTTGETVIKASAKNPSQGVGLTHVDTFTSTAGIPLYKNHKYDLVSVYNNTTSINADSMASVFLGFDDPEFVHPTATDLTRRASVLNSNSVVIHTAAGDLTAALLRDFAPTTTTQVLRLMSNGTFDHATASRGPAEVRLSAPVSEKDRRLMQPLTDHSLPLDRGMIVYCAPNGETNEVSLRIIIDPAVPHDGRCVAFARLSGGAQLVSAIAQAPVGVSAFVTGISFAR